jgi:hypothetical protein
MKEELGSDYSATLAVSEKCFDDGCLEAKIRLWGPSGRARTIHMIAEAEGQGSPMFNIWGSQEILEYISFELANDGMYAFYECFASDFPEEAPYFDGEYVRFDASTEFLTFISDELNALVAG